MYVRSCTRILFIIIRGRGWGWSASLGRALVAASWRGGLFLTEGETGVLSCVFSIFDAGGSAFVCMCVHTHTHLHSAQGVLDVSPGVGTRHLEGPKNPDELILGICVFVYVYKVHMYIYMLGGGIRSWTYCFFSLTCFFFSKITAKEVNVESRTRKANLCVVYRTCRLHLKGSFNCRSHLEEGPGCCSDRGHTTSARASMCVERGFAHRGALQKSCPQ